LRKDEERLNKAVVGFSHLMEKPMTKSTILSAGLIAAATLVTPVMAQEATQEPGAMGFSYPDSRYLTGGYGHRFAPGPGFYYRHQYPGPSAMIDAPVIGTYAYGPEPSVTWYGP
jgi:hypothetical protein